MNPAHIYTRILLRECVHKDCVKCARMCESMCAIHLMSKRTTQNTLLKTPFPRQQSTCCDDTREDPNKTSLLNIREYIKTKLVHRKCSFHIRFRISYILACCSRSPVVKKNFDSLYIVITNV